MAIENVILMEPFDFVLRYPAIKICYLQYSLIGLHQFMEMHVQEEVPTDMPTPRGKLLRTTEYQDTHLYHDLVTGKAISGILHFVKQTFTASCGNSNL